MENLQIKVYSVSELTYAIKSILESKFNFISIKGEITNLRVQASGHIYFSLKDDHAQISSVLFKGNTKNLKSLPKNGDQVIVHGEISVYPPRGNYQIIIRELEYLGVGELLLKLHALKEKLLQLGWLDQKNKKALPSHPKRIGVVTSPSGAVIQDILNVLKRRFSNFHLILNPVKVQGEGAAEEIAQAIDDFNKYNLADVLIIGRGGGSLEDLWAFNEEIVAKSIFESKIPIVSAVGHETDVTIADLVADIRAPTPSAAAEIIIKEKTQILENLKNYHLQIAKNLYHQAQSYRLKLNNFKKHPLFSSPYILLSKHMQQIDDIKSNLEYSLNHIVEQFLRDKKTLETLQNHLKNSISLIIERNKEKIEKLISHLSSINPKNLLKKGYSILLSEKLGKVIFSIKDIAEDDKIKAIVSDGNILATINRIEKK